MPDAGAPRVVTVSVVVDGTALELARCEVANTPPAVEELLQGIRAAIASSIDSTGGRPSEGGMAPVSVVVEGTAFELARCEVANTPPAVEELLQGLRAAIASSIDSTGGRRRSEAGMAPSEGRELRTSRFATAAALVALGAELVDLVAGDDGRPVYVLGGSARAAAARLEAAKQRLRTDPRAA